MPATFLSRKKTKPKTSRPPRGVTQFPGSAVFAKQHGLSHSHVYRVLKGERQSRSVLQKYSEWCAQKRIPWPTFAPAEPSRRAA